MPASDQPTSVARTSARSGSGDSLFDESALLKAGLDGTNGLSDMQAPTPADLTAAFPQLEIGAVLGQGGMGTVYRARQKHLDRDVALKVLSPKLSRDPAFVERFGREAKMLARLNHPHLVTIHDFGITSGYCWLIMELVEGANLRQVMRTGTLSPSEALALVPQLCDALQFAHDEGIVHRDIKPENILLDGKGRVKIADFGLAKLRDDKPNGTVLTASGTLLGTFHYMAPEQIENAKSVDHRADIYALGVVFYEMLTGGLPLGRFDPPSHRAEIDARLDEVVLKALAKDPDQRWQKASHVQQRMADIAATPGHGSVPVGAVPVTPRAKKPWMLWLFLIAASLAVIAVIADNLRSGFRDGLRIAPAEDPAPVAPEPKNVVLSVSSTPNTAASTTVAELTKLLNLKPLAPITDGVTAQAVIDDLQRVLALLAACPEVAGMDGKNTKTAEVVAQLRKDFAVLPDIRGPRVRELFATSSLTLDVLRVQLASGALVAGTMFRQLLARFESDALLLSQAGELIGTRSRADIERMASEKPRISSPDSEETHKALAIWLGPEATCGYTSGQAKELLELYPKPFRSTLTRLLTPRITDPEHWSATSPP
ncbi:MAG: serine/threonine-protein kinase [Planctomycetota bacterium]